MYKNRHDHLISVWGLGVVSFGLQCLLVPSDRKMSIRPNSVKRPTEGNGCLSKPKKRNGKTTGGNLSGYKNVSVDTERTETHPE